MRLRTLFIKDIKCFKEVNIQNISDINLFIGKNNSGKSTIIEALNLAHEAILPSAKVTLPKEFVRIGVTDRNPEIRLAFSPNSIEAKKLFDSFQDKSEFKGGDIENLKLALREILTKYLKIQVVIIFNKSNEYRSKVTWGKPSIDESPPNIISAAAIIRMEGLHGFQAKSVSVIFKEFLFKEFVKLAFPTFKKIPDIREIKSSERKDFNLSTGKGLVEHLFNLKNLQDRKKRKIVSDLQKKFQDITDEKFSFDLFQDTDTPAIKRMIVSTDLKKDEELNIKDLGMGSRELLILLNAISYFKESNIGIEEPEIHFHPEYQKRFFSYLKKHANYYGNQFFIATHSHILFNENKTGASYVLRSIDDKTSSCSQVNYADDGDIKKVLDELGLGLSDFYFYNGLFFVEGKDEEEAFNIWARFLSNEGLDLRDRGINFVVMGGARNMSYFAESKVLEKISTLHIPYLIVIDRDEKSKKEVTRLKRNYENLVVLQKREFENYLISEDIFKEYIKDYYSYIYEEKGEEGIQEEIQKIFTDSISELKDFYKSVLFIDEVTNDILNGWSILKKSEIIFSIVENSTRIDEESLIKSILREKKRDDLIPKFTTSNKKQYKNLWNRLNKDFENNWVNKWKVKYKISNIPGKELLKKILKKLEEKGISLSKKELIQFISEKPDFIPDELKNYLETFFEQS